MWVSPHFSDNKLYNPSLEDLIGAVLWFKRESTSGNDCSSGVQMADDIMNRLERRYAAGTKLFSNQKHLELLCVAVFLELAGIEFESSQLKPSQAEPPDIIFQPMVSFQRQQESCKFEVTECLDSDTKRNHEMWESHRIVQSAIVDHISFEDYVSQRNIIPKPKTAIAFESLLELIKLRVDEKYKWYKKRRLNVQDIDLIIIAQLRNLFLQPNQNICCPDERIIKAWRSFSFLMEPYCGVIYLSDRAPKVLRDIHRRGLICVDNRPDIWDEMIQKLGLPYELG
jgi:hypothetical protein